MLRLDNVKSGGILNNQSLFTSYQNILLVKHADRDIEDINDFLQSQTWDIGASGTRVLDMNQRELTDICKSYGFTTFLTSSTSQQKLAKTQKELGIEMHGVALQPATMGSDGIDLCSNSTPSCRACCAGCWGNPAHTFKHTRMACCQG